MSSFIDNLREYFNNNTKEKIKEDWESTSIWDTIGFTWEEYYQELQNLVNNKN